jgi:hypothetical protein
MASRDLPWEFHKVYPSLDVQNIPGYPNHFSIEWRENFPKFNGDPALAVTHVMNYMKYASSLNVLHEDVLMKILYLHWNQVKGVGLHTHVIQEVSHLLQISLNNFSGIIGQLPRICKILSKSSKTLFAEKVFL